MADRVEHRDILELATLMRLHGNFLTRERDPIVLAHLHHAPTKPIGM